MIEPPDLTGLVASVLARDFGLQPSGIDFQWGGQDDEATVCRISAGAGPRPAATHVVKVRNRRSATRVGPDVATFLASRGLPLVVAPLPSAGGPTTIEVGERTITVYPFIEGARGADVGLTGEQWFELGGFVRRLHEIRLPTELSGRIPVETFEPAGLDAMPTLPAQLTHLALRSAALDRVRSIWSGNRDRITALVQRTRALMARVRGRTFDFVTCHADLHVYNVLVGIDGRVHVIDWDEVVRAPLERDLMFVIGGIAEELMPESGTARFLEGYGDVYIDQVLLAYYRHAWAVQDISSYTLRMLDQRRDEAGRAEAAEILASLFRSGEIVDLSERKRP